LLTYEKSTTEFKQLMEPLQRNYELTKADVRDDETSKERLQLASEQLKTTRENFVQKYAAKKYLQKGESFVIKGIELRLKSTEAGQAGKWQVQHNLAMPKSNGDFLFGSF
jgi:outer membrane receptor for monomeric catechols